MNKIEIKVLNPQSIEDAQKMMVCAARLTQRGEKIKTADDFMGLYNKSFTADTVYNMNRLPHPTIQKFAVINVAVVGASRRFLAQITRHQNEVKFMSASLQYSDYSDEAAFTVPYSILASGQPHVYEYLNTCKAAMNEYEAAIRQGVDNDAAGYLMPQALRNVLIISATPYQWKHMISQRICRRNTDETRYVMLKIWEELHYYAPWFFTPETTSAFCAKQSGCLEGKMSCGNHMRGMLPEDIIAADFPLLKGEKYENKAD